MEIYIDLIILQDTFIMTLILSLVSTILNLKIKLSKIILCSFFTSLLTILIMIFLPMHAKSFCTTLIVSLLTIILAFGLKSIKQVTKNHIYALLVTFLLGGVGTAINTGPFVMLIIFLLITIYIAKSYSKAKVKFLIEQTMCDIEFEFKNKKYNLKALIDTGNNVKTIFGEEVIFISEKAFLVDGGERKVRYKTVSGVEEKDGVKIKNIKYNYAGINKINDAILVSTKNISNEFDAILSFNFIKGGIENGNTIAHKKACTKINL